MNISDTAVTSDYADGYRAGMNAAKEVCESFGYALDGGNNRYVYDKGAVTCARLIEKSLELAVAGLSTSTP